MGTAAESAMRDALARKPSVEASSRLETLIGCLSNKRHFPEELSHIRAIQVLEMLGTKESQELLKTLADGAEGATRTTDARQALRRLR